VLRGRGQRAVIRVNATQQSLDVQSLDMESLDMESRPALLARQMGQELVVLDTSSNHIHQLNLTATVIFRMKQHGAAAGEVAKVLADTFDVEEDAALRDVESTLAQFQSLKLLDVPVHMEKDPHEP
jgi:hypothetical protein